MQIQQNKELFQLQTELVDMKVNMAVNSAIDQVIKQIQQFKNDVHHQINELRNEMHTQISHLKADMQNFKQEIREEMHELRHEMRDRFSSLENRVTAVETKLGMVSEPRKEIRNRFIDYCFKAGWLMLAATVSYFALQLQLFIR